MSQPISVDILSDDEDDQNEPENDPLSTPFPIQSKRQRTEPPFSNPTVLLIDDDHPTPLKRPSFVPETPISPFSNSDVAIVKCIKAPSAPHKFSGVSGLICLESDNESENSSGKGNWKHNETLGIAFDVVNNSEFSSRLIGSAFSLGTEEGLPGHENLTQMSGDSSLHLMSSKEVIPQVNDILDEEIDRLESTGNLLRQNSRSKVSADMEKNVDGGNGKKRMTKEEKIRLKEEKKQLREQEKLQKAAMKAEAAELKKLQKEKQKWEKGKFALKSVVAEIDTKVVELGSVGGHLLTRFAEKGLTFRITPNPIERSILWNMSVPEEISQLPSDGFEIQYVLIVFEAEEFCNLVTNESLLMDHVLSKLATHFFRVHSRLCVDEAELAEHVVGLTCSLASCQFRKKLTRLSVNSNGSLIPKDCIDRNLIKKSTLKALVAIPKVQPRFAIAISKRYPTMKSLLTVYMDPNKSVHEKEFLLKDLIIEGLLGEDRRLGEVCSKRVYRILMAQCGSIKTDDVEDGADFFGRHST
ncbi:hypothetical protein HYC85_001573 [Camellia sinensis]|uniref:ERCC4 domain-containing protein n=1 Tax=Camellia sinensis TaxID=4442 RepID=A0A7J7I7M1_CAMSI|nr:hypothetical protein HYC85_001573 [Camellia sinensis]